VNSSQIYGSFEVLLRGGGGGDESMNDIFMALSNVEERKREKQRKIPNKNSTT
jgi:hypothetical protein